MQKDNGLTSFLKYGGAYDFLQKVAGTHKVRAWVASRYWRAEKSSVIVDLGCGTGTALNYLPSGSSYIGVDASSKYIERARKHYGGRGTFFTSTISDAMADSTLSQSCADLVLCNGLLHHMDDDQALETIDYARSLLSSTGRFVCTEPTFLAHQSYVSRLVMGWDRGKNIRSETEWKKLFQNKFSNIDTNIFFGVSSFPFIRIVVVMTKSDIGEL